jgi:hypothetical protein
MKLASQGLVKNGTFRRLQVSVKMATVTAPAHSEMAPNPNTEKNPNVNINDLPYLVSIAALPF